MDFDLPVLTLLLIDPRDRTVITHEEETAGGDEAFVVEVFELGFAVKGVFASQTDEARITRNP